MINIPDMIPMIPEMFLWNFQLFQLMIPRNIPDIKHLETDASPWICSSSSRSDAVKKPRKVLQGKKTAATRMEVENHHFL